MNPSLTAFSITAPWKWRGSTIPNSGSKKGACPRVKPWFEGDTGTRLVQAI